MLEASDLQYKKIIALFKTHPTLTRLSSLSLLNSVLLSFGKKCLTAFVNVVDF